MWLRPVCVWIYLSRPGTDWLDIEADSTILLTLVSIEICLLQTILTNQMTEKSVINDEGIIVT